MDLFNNSNQPQENIPLAERMRPQKLEDIVGQPHLIGEKSPLRSFFNSCNFPSIIMWGPPGVGKTTFAQLIASVGYVFFQISAIDAGVKEVRQIIAQSQYEISKGKRCLLFIDEIHRFNKSQQDALLNAVEKGIITLIGATTENPSFEVNNALMSRCQVYQLKPLTDIDIKNIIDKAIDTDVILSKLNVVVDDYDFIVRYSGGDARNALNALELAVKFANDINHNTDVSGHLHLINEHFEKALQQKSAFYDKNGESHYDNISAFIKSLRGSDPDAAIYWMAKMLDAGEDPKFIARRMIIFASEDVGNADPFAVTLAVAIFQAVQIIGMPECRINLAQCVTYLASCSKSNSSYLAIDSAMSDIRNSGALVVPLHLRNAPTTYMKKEGYGKGYKYPHDFDNHFVEENYFPDGMKSKIYYRPTQFGKEKYFSDRLTAYWGDNKKY